MFNKTARRRSPQQAVAAHARWLKPPVYAVYAISSLDTEPSLRHRTQNCMKLRRDTTGSIPWVARESSGPGGFKLPVTCLCCHAVSRPARSSLVYAVYAISSLDTGSPLSYRTQNMQPRRDTPGSCRAHSPTLHVGTRDRVASRPWSCTSHPHAHLHATGAHLCIRRLCCLCNKLARH